MELMAGARDKREVDYLERYLADYRQIPLSEGIGNRARQIMKTYAKADGLDPLDALIAATAMDENLKLATQNDKHFRNIEGLDLEVVRFPSDPDGDK